MSDKLKYSKYFKVKLNNFRTVSIASMVRNGKIPSFIKEKKYQELQYYRIEIVCEFGKKRKRNLADNSRLTKTKNLGCGFSLVVTACKDSLIIREYKDRHNHSMETLEKRPLADNNMFIIKTGLRMHWK